MNWKRVISGVLAAAMLSALPVQLLVSAEGTEAVGQADGWEKLTTPEPLDECNAFFYSKDDQTFEKITHPEKDSGMLKNIRNLDDNHSHAPKIGSTLLIL